MRSEPGTSATGEGRSPVESPYVDLQSRLAEIPSDLRVSALPDGSIDRRYRIQTGVGGGLTTRAALATAIEDGRKSLRLVPERTEPGGQAVNLAIGAHELGAKVALCGHLDAPEMPAFPFETHSFGEPATVRVLDLEDDAVMLAEESGDVRSWGTADLEAALESPVDPLDADVVCWCNWVSFPRTTEAIRIASTHEDDAVRDGTPRIHLVDPGDLVGSDPDAISELLDALGELQDPEAVMVNANRAEIREIAAAIDADPSTSDPQAHEREDERLRDDDERLRAIRDHAGIAGVVMHAEPRAAMAVGDDHVVSVPNFRLEDPDRRIGGGDRFGSGFAVGLAAGWPVETALACGNAAAAYYLTHDRTGDAEDLRAFVRERSPSNDDGGE